MTYDDALAAPAALVVFSADWCAPCQALKPLLAGLPVAVVDVESSPALARQHAVRSLPTIIVMQSGRPVQTHIGSATRAELEAMAGGPE